MALDASFVGRAYQLSRPYEVGREKIREFADAIGDGSPVYRDAEAAKAAGYPDVIAPPTFPVIVSFRASGELITDPDLGIDYSRVVHGEQRFVYTRPVRAGDRLTATLVVESIRSAAGNDLVGTRTDISTVDGEHVVTAYSTIVSRGTAAEGGA
jgi:acyl dehydratase